ncbi:ribosomal protein S18-alanine N-acetyltransferase [Gordonibacter massiliensis (ex Traore et al. 2017)]|uniref:ribosomal protein S18-alanine N-acetyltransferase n=1 Tax=Gordonibacter massiliensis (ex Traore et al. 2017) TaxID=1841863 RepID=UPI001C8BADFD|nr:ribosomal protein S18-alanine N-acetyltransferase [Gordonibacter massiliensis (ex Traore et al. 2017)]MBX9035007.1 ribosomal protein S18-alanine N-acetyltransferase [Gordonibacter massiliensis (ex Traore et al. 2017)]
MSWGKGQITKQAYRTAPEDYAAFEAVNLAGRDGVRVLDVGCFDGFNTRLKFAPYAGVTRVVGIDPMADAVAEAAALTAGDPRFSFACTTFEEYEPGDEERFDLVYFSHVLQHLPDPQAALDKACRLLEPGGFVVVKTVDDAAKLSYPDPDAVMRRLFALYERHVLPNTPHTSRTDRYNGEKCYTLMKRAGLDNVRVRTFSADTAGKELDERRALFERCVYFRRNVPPCVDEAAANEIRALADAWGALFERDDYYFSSQSFVVIGQKPQEGEPPWTYAGPVFGDGAAAEAPRFAKAGGAEISRGERTAGGAVSTLAIRPLAERDLGRVMGIEVASFRDPWTPLAFALELRHNPCAHYAAAVVDGDVAGYLGWWGTPEGAAIVRVAVDPALRKAGVGRALVEQAARRAREEGHAALKLEVRAGNAVACAFYARLGFLVVAVRAGYYDDPPEDALVMALPLG